jgi:hypothetical protein
MACSAATASYDDRHAAVKSKAARAHTTTTATTAHVGAATTTATDHQIFRCHRFKDLQGVRSDGAELMHAIRDTTSLNEVDVVAAHN